MDSHFAEIYASYEAFVRNHRIKPNSRLMRIS
jgi:hypothetical protein